MRRKIAGRLNEKSSSIKDLVRLLVSYLLSQTLCADKAGKGAREVGIFIDVIKGKSIFERM